jgi:hypothetical protein
MSEGTRAVALSEAVKAAGALGFTALGQIIEVAEQLNTFLNADLQVEPKAEAPKAEKPAKVIEKPKAEKPAKVIEKPKAPAISIEDIGKAIASLLEAQKRTELKALLSKYGAQNKSTLQEDDYEAFLSEAKGLLEEADPTA